MSMIHSSWLPVGCSAALRCGTARLRTVRSMTVIMHGRARTARPTQAARGACCVRIPSRRTAPRTIDMHPDEEELGHWYAVPRGADERPAHHRHDARLRADAGPG